MGLIQSYSSIKKLPSDLKTGHLYVDDRNDTILLPMSSEQFVPFHVSTINTVSKQEQGQWTYLRINFHTPNPSGKQGALQFPDMSDPNAVFLKEVTFKNCERKGENNNLRACEKKIKDMIKRIKAADAEEDDKKESAGVQQAIVVMQGRKDTLDNVIVKPNLDGRKTLGNVELHQNGLRYTSTKNQKVDIPFSNVKHAFFQPCGHDELISILHFTLKVPITLNNKKISDVQFFKESGTTADDIDMKGGRRRMNDLDELELEEKERQAKKRLSQKFFTYAKLIQSQSEKTSHVIEFDIPIEDFVFEGVPAKSVVKIRPTSKCLISISEYPPFCVELKNIEHVHFERVQFGIKNFDMCIVMKDFQTFKHINSIRREELDYIKQYLN